MGSRSALVNFSKGVLSPSAEARFDLPLYGAGARKASNVKIQRTGGLKKRMGTRFVAEASADMHLIPFQFSDDQAYVLGMEQANMRPFALGGAVLEPGLHVSAITKAANAKVTCAYHGYAASDPVYFNSIQGMIEINDRFLTVVSVIDANNFTVNFDSTNAHTFTGDTGGIVNSAPPPPPPPPPPVPDPVPVPDPPPIGSGSGGGYDDSGDGDGLGDWNAPPPNIPGGGLGEGTDYP